MGKPDVSLFAEEAEAGHGDLHGLWVDAPQVHEENDLEFDVGLLANGYVGAVVDVVPVPLEEEVPSLQDLPQPLQHLGRVEDLVLDQLLRHGEQHLGVDVPEGVDHVVGVPHLDLVGLVEDQEGLHGLHTHVGHVGLLHQTRSGH